MTKMVKTWDAEGELKTLRGSKSGGGSQRTPVESPDSLRSVAMARILDLVSEGEIYGFADPAKPLTCVFYNETPVANTDGSLNFQNVQIDSRTGTQTQDYMRGFPSVESESLVNVELTFGTPWTRGFTNTSLSAVNVKIAVPILTKQNTENGDIGGSTVAYKIELSVDGGPFVAVLDGRFVGKTTSKYVRGHRIDLPHADTGWTIRVRRMTADSSTSAVQDATWIDSFTEVIDAKLRYPMSAIIGNIIYAEQFSNIPSRSYHLKGRLIRVPSNYNPDTGVYTGIWDGTFQTRYSNNPAWVFYDLATNTRYGLGRYVSSDLIDRWNLYRIAQYCDGLVNDGKGGTERRFTCNVYLQSRNDALKVMQDIATVFRGIMYAEQGAITAVADMPETVAYTYAPSNVIDGKFVYGGSRGKVRHTVALVSWNDMSDFGRAKVQYVDDPEGIDRYGVQETEVIAVGCTSQGQALRFGKYILTTERLETDSVTFGVGLDGTLVAPGKIVAIADPLKAGRRMGGRISAATATVITLDKTPEVAPVAGDKLSVNLPSGVLQERTVQSFNAGTRAVTVTSAYSELPQRESQWLLERSDLVAQKFRIVSIAENDEHSGYVVTAIQHVEGKFAYVENGIKIDNPPISALPSSIVPSPQNLVCEQREIRDENSATKVAMLTWDRVPVATSYNVQWRHGEGSWIDVGNNASNQREIYGIPMGPFEVQVIAINALGVRSLPTFGGPYDIVPLSIPPGFVDGINDDLLELDDKITQEVIDRSNAIAAEAAARTDAIEAEAAARADAILNERIITEAAIEAEAVIRQTTDESLSAQINSIVAGSGEQFDGAEIWYFDTTTEGFTGNAGTATVTEGWLKGPNGTDPSVVSPAYVVDGATYRNVKMRVRKTGTFTWLGRVYYRTGAAAWSANVTVVEPDWNVDDIATIDFSDIAWPADTTQIRVELIDTQDASNFVEFDWIAVGRPAPGASMAALQEEAIARVTGDTAEATQRALLAAQIRGGYTGNDIDALTSGLIFSEKNLRIAADSALASDITTLSARVTNTEDDIDLQAQATQALETRVENVEGDITVQSSQIVNLTSRMGTAEGQISGQANAINSLDTRVTNVENVNTTQATAITKLTVSLAEVDRIFNGSFEVAADAASGGATRPDQWGSGVGITTMPTGVVRTTAAGVAYHGTAALQFDGVANGVYRAVWSWSRIMAQAGDKVRLRMRHKSGSTPPDLCNVNIEVYWVNSAGAFVSATPIGVGVNGAYAYTVLEGVVTAPTNAAYGYVRVLVGDQVSGSIIIDFVEFSKQTLDDVATASALQTLETRVQTTENGVAANSSSITQLNTTVAGKADVSAVTALNTRVNYVEGQSDSNLLQNSNWSSDTVGWTLAGNTGDLGLAARNAHGPVWQPDYMNTMVLGFKNATTPTGSWAGFDSPRFGVEQFQTYVASAFLAAHRASICGVQIVFFDAAGAVISVPDNRGPVGGAGRSIGDPGQWTRRYVAGVCPAGAVSAHFRAFFFKDAGTTSDPYLWILRPKVEIGRPGQTTPTAYGSGGLEMAASYTLRLDVNGYIAGWNFNNNGSQGQLAILADYFVIAKPSGGVRTEYSNGNWRVYDGAGVLRTRMGVW